MVKMDEVIDLTVSTLETGIADPLTRRSADSRKWIHSDFPLLSSAMPRIAVEPDMINNPDYYAINSQEKEEHFFFKVSFLLNEKQKLDFDVDGVFETTTQCLGYYEDKIKSVVVGAKSTFLALGVVLDVHSRQTLSLKFPDSGVLGFAVLFEIVFLR
jgi:hypothetical protein